MIYENILSLIGNTPIIKFEDIFIKLESFNIAGSIKDRVALNMIEKLIEDKKIKNGSTVIEVTSGNTGIAIAMVCAIKRLKCLIFMLDNVSKEKINIIKAYGGKVILTKAELGMPYAFKKAREYAKKKNYYFLDQFSNLANPSAHIITAKEIIKDLPKIDYLVTGIGTGGTISGLGKYLKSYNPKIKIIAVEPFEIPYVSSGGVFKYDTNNPNGIQGIGATFPLKVLDKSVIDDIRLVKTKDAFKTYLDLSQKGLFLGLSSAANYLVSKQIKYENPNSIVLMISPDNGMKYLNVILND